VNNTCITISAAGTYVRGSERLTIAAAVNSEIFQHDPDRAVIDADQAHFPWTWRYAHADERFVPLGAPGKQTVVKHLANRGVASQYRALTPVLADVSGIIWIPGFTLAHRVRVLPTTVHTWAIQRSQSEP
jgi:tRNA(Ile)-lysidine synthase